jgi:hypothetical protein
VVSFEIAVSAYFLLQFSAHQDVYIFHLYLMNFDHLLTSKCWPVKSNFHVCLSKLSNCQNGGCSSVRTSAVEYLGLRAIRKSKGK